MLRKGLSIFLCIMLFSTIFPINAFAGEAYQYIPLRNEMETTSGVSGQYVVSTLTQDRMSGKYSVKVVAGDAPNVNYVQFNLAQSDPFYISKSNRIKLWIKPGAGAQWIKFFTKDNIGGAGSQIMGDKDADGMFEVGQDITSGQWTQLDLDLSRFSNPNIVEVKDLWVQSNDFSSWYFDDIQSCLAPNPTVNLDSMINSSTQLVNGSIQFKAADSQKYNTLPTVLTSNSGNLPKPVFQRNSMTYDVSGNQIPVNNPYYREYRKQYAEDTFAEFSDGTLSNLKPGSSGNLELDKTGVNYTKTETSQSDLQQGTLSNTVANQDGSLSLSAGYLVNDGFEDGDITEYTNYRNFTVTNSGSYSGTYSVFCSSDEVLSRQVLVRGNYSPNKAFKTYVYYPNQTRLFELGIAFGVGSTSPSSNCYAAYYSPKYKTFYLYRYIQGNKYLLASNTMTSGYSGWLKIVVLWGTGGQITAKLFDSAGNLVSTVNAVDSYYTNGAAGLFTGYNDDIFRFDNFTIADSESQLDYPSSGTRMSPVMNLSSVNTAKSSTISWNATLPQGTGVTVETNLSLDGGVTWQGWKTATNSGEIQGITKGTNLSNARLQTKQTLTTNTPSVTPYFNDLTINIDTGYKNSGNRISSEISVNLPTRAASSNISWVSNNPANTSMNLSISWDNGLTWLPCSNGQALPGIAGRELLTSKFKLKEELSTSDVAITPWLDSVSLNIVDNLGKGISINPGNGSTIMPDNVSYLFSKPVNQRNFGCLLYVPNINSSSLVQPISIFNGYNNLSTLNRYSVKYENSKFVFKKYNGYQSYECSSNTFSFNSGDAVFIAWLDDPIKGYMKLWVGKNQGNLTELTTYNIARINDLQKVYVGCNSTSGSEANGTIDCVQLIDVNDFEASGQVLDSTFVTNQYQLKSSPVQNLGQILLCNYENTLESSAISTGNNTVTLPSGKISKITVDSHYASASGQINSLPVQRLFLSGVQPTKLALSGDGNRLFYANPGDAGKLYLLNLLTGENRKISDYVPEEIKVNLGGTIVAYKDINNVLYQSNISYDSITGNVSSLSTGTVWSSVGNYDIQNDGTLCYYRPSNKTIYYAGTACQTISASPVMSVSRTGNKIFYGLHIAANSNKLFSLTSTPAGWKSEELYNSATDITGVWTNSDGSLVFFSTNSGIYCYQASSKVLRKLDIPVVVSYDYPNKQIVKVTDDNKLIIQLENYKYQVYDTDTDTSKDIRPSDAVNPPDAQTLRFNVDNSGNKMAYVASGGLSTYYFNGVQKPERYLLSFDGKQSWVSYKEGVWKVVKTGANPTESEFKNYGMTIDEVNSLNESDFDRLYEGNRQVLQFDVAVYFASVDPYITPVLKEIRMEMNSGDFSSSGQLIPSSLFMLKAQDFDTSRWRKLKKINVVEIQPNDAEMIYFVKTADGNYKSFKNGQWAPVNSSLFLNIENNWVQITQEGMNSEEIRNIPESSINTLLPSNNLSIVYAIKVNDYSTESYVSLISPVFVEDLFVSQNLTLKVTMTDGTIKEFSGMSEGEIEDFMTWLNLSKRDNGSAFYCIKRQGTTPGMVRINEYLNYYMVQSAVVEELT